MGMNQEELLIKVNADISNAQRELGRLQTDVKQKMLNVRKKIDKAVVFNGDRDAFKKQFRTVKSQTAYIDSQRKKYAKLGYIQRQNAIDAQKSINPLKKQQAQLQEGLGKTKAKLNKSRVAFAGWAMSIMFFGMALQRLFTQIWKFGSKTFQEISHSVENSVTGFDMLEGSVKYLGFTIGAALEPLAMLLLPIIDKITDWVSENEALVASIVKIGAVMGAVMFAAGTLVLAFNGFKQLGLILTTASVPAGIVAAALVAIGAISWKAFKETPEAWKAMKDLFSNIDFKGIGKELSELAGTIGIDWGTAAWTIVKWGDIFIQTIEFTFNAIKIFINLISLLVRSANQALTSMKNLLTLNFSGLTESESLLKGITSDLYDIGEAAVDAFGNIKEVVKIASTDVDTYKQQKIAEQTSPADLRAQIAAAEAPSRSAFGISQAVNPINNFTVMIGSEEVAAIVSQSQLDSIGATTTNMGG